jgi:GT2 family glycosyltransferase
VIGVSVVLYASPIPALTATMIGIIEQSRPPAFVAIHVNSASDSICDSVQAMLDQLTPSFPVEITSSPENQGFCRAHNNALRAGFARDVSAMVVLNPDLVLDGQALEALAAADTEDRLLGPVLELADPATMRATGRIDTTGIRWTRSGRHLDADQGQLVADVTIPGPRVVAGVSGACLYVPRLVHDAVIAATGEFFDDDFFAYREDAELGLRAGMLGFDSVVVPAARGRHIRRLRGTTRGGNRDIDRLGVRNRFLIAFKYGAHRPGSLPLILARDLIVGLAALTVERSSRSGLVEAWRLRDVMRAKGALISAAAARNR